MAKTEQQDNKIWVELAKPRSKEHAEKQCELANNMLRRLHKPANRSSMQTFWYDQERSQYCYGGPMGFEHLGDRGKWLNLDYMGRDGT